MLKARSGRNSAEVRLDVAQLARREIGRTYVVVLSSRCVSSPIRVERWPDDVTKDNLESRLTKQTHLINVKDKFECRGGSDVRPMNQKSLWYLAALEVIKGRSAKGRYCRLASKQERLQGILCHWLDWHLRPIGH